MKNNSFNWINDNKEWSSAKLILALTAKSCKNFHTLVYLPFIYLINSPDDN